MKYASLTSALAALAVQHVVTAAPASSSRRQQSSACADLNAIIMQDIQQNNSIILDGQAAYSCLKEIPLDTEKATLFVQEVTKHVQWQSDLAALKSPPDGSASNDILQKLSDFEQKVKDNGYTAQVDFDTDLRELLNSANDEHFGVFGQCTSNIFSFAINVTGLVSAAESTTSEPQIYVTDQLLNGELSPIATINGQDPAEFLEKYSALYSFQGADARYNALFSSYARRSNSADRRGHFIYDRGLWQGYGAINYTYANGTEGSWPVLATLQNQAAYNYETGQQLFEAFCLPQSTLSGNETDEFPDTTPPDEWTAPPNDTDSTPTRRQAGSFAPVAVAGPVHYPEPVLRDPYNMITGYYLNGTHEDTAVLYIPDFQTSGNDGITGMTLPDNQLASFAGAAARFLQEAKSAGKTKLILDLTANLGGSTASGYNLFRLLFPNTNIYTANRYRNHEFVRLLIEALATYKDDNPNVANEIPALSSHLLWQDQVSPDQSPTGWTDFQGWIGNDSELLAATAPNNFTRISSADLPIEGYGTVSTTFQSPPFEPENILIVTDGSCASTCSNFVDLMMALGNVTSTLAWGGRPKSKSMQLVGGVRGSEVVKFDQVALAAKVGLNYIEERMNASKPTLSEEQQERYKALMPIDPSAFPLKLITGAVNLRNTYDQGNDIPLQFDHQAAGCHLFYTPQNIKEPGTTWNDAADAWASNGCKAPAREGGGGTQTQSESPSSTSITPASTNAGSKTVSGSMAAAVALLFAALLL